MPPDLFSSSFDYNHVDGLGRASQRGKLPHLNGQSFRANHVGPVIEFANLADTKLETPLPEADWFDDNPLLELFHARDKNLDHWLQSDNRRGFANGNGLLSEGTLNSLKIDAHKAALAANFGTSAPLLVAAFGELIGNIIDHSEATPTGFASFAAQNGSFEFVVADRGIGALKSLRKCVEHSTIGDDGAALNAIIESGVSRFGSGSGHGNGFRPIFEKMAEMNGELRFRSGDYALTLSGKFGDKIHLQLSQKPRILGFFAGIVCNTK